MYLSWILIGTIIKIAIYDTDKGKIQIYTGSDHHPISKKQNNYKT